MTKRYCWCCERGFETDDLKFICLCGAENDFSEYKPIQEESDMIPEAKGGTQFNEFIKLPNPLEGREGDVKVGDCVTIKDEFVAPPNEKIKAFIFGGVDLNGTTKTLCINQTSYFEIAKVLGKDTAAWVGKNIEYKGMKKFAKGTGHLWTAQQ